MKQQTGERGRIVLEAVLGIAFFLAIAYLSGFFFKRFDLTEEKRHTLTQVTVDLLQDLDDVVYVKVFLDGDFPADYQRLQQAVKEKLDEMRAYAGDNIQYEFINPSDAVDKESREAMYGELVEKGLQFTSLQIREKDGLSEKIIFPGALISYKDRELPLQILKNQQRVTDAELVNRTINNIEYEFVNAIYQIRSLKRPKIAFIEGHGELEPIQTRDFELELGRYYDVEHLEIGGQVNALSKNVAGAGRRENRYDAIVIAKPTKPYSEQDKYIIDQFIMAGGKAIWLVDPMEIGMDSLQTQDVAMATPLQTNLDDMLFTYGVRLNRDLLIDRTCAPISLLTGPKGNERNELFPWYFRPVIIPATNHPITANIDPVLTEFVSSMDTVESPGIRKQLILSTSEYTRILKSPVRVSLNIVSIDPEFGASNRPNQTIGVLLEGEFRSNFTNRLPPNFLNERLFAFQEQGDFTRMLVIADGDVARNEVSPDGTKFRELGWDPVLKRRLYGNKEFLVNAMNYLLGDANLIDVRSRSVKVRKLDDERSVAERQFWQVINIGLPIVITILFGLLQWVWRRRRFAKE